MMRMEGVSIAVRSVEGGVLVEKEIAVIIRDHTALFGAYDRRLVANDNLFAVRFSCHPMSCKFP